MEYLIDGYSVASQFHLILEMAEQQALSHPVIEDDTYEELNFDESRCPYRHLSSEQ